MLFSPKRLIGLLVGCAALFSLSTSFAENTLRIGYQRSSTLMTLLKTQGTLEKRFAEQGIQISWHEFPNGLPLLEALNVGNVDVSADVADTVPVFAQAAGADITYFAEELPSPTAQALLLHADSPITHLSELKGKKIAVTKGAGNHYLLLAILNKAGLRFSDIEPAYVTPADGRAAFENRKVDAWVTWEPFFSSAQRQLDTRTLADGTGLADYKRYYLASSRYATTHHAELKQLFDALAQTGEWLKNNPEQAAKVLAPLWGNLEVATVLQANQRRSYAIRPVKLEALGEQQKIADAFYREGLLPKTVNARDVHIFTP